MSLAHSQEATTSQTITRLGEVAHLGFWVSTGTFSNSGKASDQGQECGHTLIHSEEGGGLVFLSLSIAFLVPSAS